MVSFVGVSADSQAASTLSLPWPAARAAGDAALLLWNGQSGITWQPPTGFTLIHSETGGGGSQDGRVYIRVLDGSESGSVALTHSTSDKQSGILALYRDVDQATPVDDWAVRLETVDSTSHENPEIVSTVPDVAVVTWIHERFTDSSTGYQAPSGYVLRAYPPPVGGGGSTSAAFADDGLSVARAAGAYTPPPWTGGALTDNVLTWTLALRPSSAPAAEGTGTMAASATATGQGTKHASGTATVAVSASLTGQGEADLPPSGAGTITAAAALAAAGAKGTAGTGAVDVDQALVANGAKAAAGTGTATATATAAGVGDGAETNPPTFPDAPLPVLVELQLDGVWTDITEDVYMRDEIEIERGRADEGNRVDPTKCRLTLNNRTGRYSPRNPLSPLYGALGRNTPIRVSVAPEPTAPDEAPEWHIRFVGEVASWPVRWDISERDQYVSIEASGILRRLGQGAKPLQSALYRSIAGAGLSAWWPLEDAPGSRQAAPGYPGNLPAQLIGDVTFTGDPYEGIGGGAQIGERSEILAGLSSPSNWALACWVDVPADIGETTLVPIMQWTTPASPGITFWYMYTIGAPSYGGAFVLEAFTAADNAALAEVGSIDLRGRGPVQVLVTAQPTGTGYWLRAYVDGVLDLELHIDQGVATPVTTLAVSARRASGVEVAGTVSHLLVGDQTRTSDILALRTAAHGWPGETAGARFARLCAEEGIPAVLDGDPADTAPMGPQQIRTLLELLGECEEADGGTMSEQRDALGLAYRTRTENYNTLPVLMLDYASGDVAPPLEPVEDDQQSRNDIKATRQGGSSAQVVVEDGPLSVQPPPLGIGRYDESVTLNVEQDAQLLPIAGWRAHRGTWDEARYPTVAVNLAARPGLITDALTVDTQSHVRMINLPPWLPPGDVDLIVEGYAERIGDYDWDLAFNTSPQGPWRVAQLDAADLGRLDTAGAELVSAVDEVADEFVVQTTAGPRWVTDPAEFPFDVQVGGEVVTVTGIAGATSVQTFTVMRAANGIVKSHPAGTSVRLAHPIPLAL